MARRARVKRRVRNKGEKGEEDIVGCGWEREGEEGGMENVPDV